MSGTVEASVDSFFGDERSRNSSRNSSRSPSPNVDSSRSASPSRSSSSSDNESSGSSRDSSRNSLSGNSSRASSTSRSRSASPNTARSKSDESDVETTVAPTTTERSQVDTQRTENYENDNFEPEEDSKEVLEKDDSGGDPIRAKSPQMIQVDKIDLDKKSESEGELTDVSPMGSPRPNETTVIKSVDLNDDDLETATKLAQIELEKDEIQDIRVSVAKTRPKSAHPRNRGRKVSDSGSVNSSLTSFDFGDVKNKNEIKRHRDRLLYTTSKSTKDLNHLLEAVLILDQKGAEREAAKNPNPFPPRAVGSARSSRGSFAASERQREIQKENERLLKELTKQRRRPNSATSVSSVRSNMSRGSAFSTASAVEFRKSANCRGSPIARNYHSKINRTKEAKRIDEENLALLRRLQNVRASPMIALSRQQVMAPQRARPRTMRPKIVNTWTDGW